MTLLSKEESIAILKKEIPKGKIFGVSAIQRRLNIGYSRAYMLLKWACASGQADREDETKISFRQQITLEVSGGVESGLRSRMFNPSAGASDMAGFDGTRALIYAEDLTFCERLAKLLDIQDDGGDAPADVVRWAIHKAADGGTMLYYPRIKCPRGLTTCRSYGQVVQNDDEPMRGSFFCCGKNDGTMAPIKEDRYTLCFHGEFRDTMSFNDRRDLIDQMHVIAAAMSHIELERVE